MVTRTDECLFNKAAYLHVWVIGYKFKDLSECIYYKHGSLLSKSISLQTYCYPNYDNESR